MASLNTGYDWNTRLNWYIYTIVNKAQAMKTVLIHLSVSLAFLFVLSLSTSFLSLLHLFLKSFLS